MKLAVIYLGFNNPGKYKRGVENVIEIQARSLPKDSRKYYLFFDAENSVVRWGDIVAVGIKYSRRQFLDVNFIVRSLQRRLQKRGFSVLVHAHHYLTATFLWRRTDVFTVHDGLWYQKKMVGSRIPWFFYLVERWVYWRARNLECDSNFTLKNSLLTRSGRLVRVVHCSTPLEAWRGEGRKQPLRLSRQGEAMVFSVRSIEERARVDLILEVAEGASARGIPMMFVIAGKGPLLPYYRDQVERRGVKNVRLLGYVDDGELARLYAGCDVVLMLCEYGEGFGLPAIEGYMFGKPVIASNRCAVPEVVISPQGLVENEAEGILERIVETLTAHPTPEELAAYYESRFSNAIVVAQFRQMYDEICQSRFRSVEVCATAHQ